MKIQISKYGSLSIERGSQLREQYCPRSEGEAQAHCGDWCPLFREPEPSVRCMIPDKTKCPTDDCVCCPYNMSVMQLTICEEHTLVGDITDLRVHTPPNPPGG